MNNKLLLIAISIFLIFTSETCSNKNQKISPNDCKVIQFTEFIQDASIIIDYNSIKNSYGVNYFNNGSVYPEYSNNKLIKFDYINDFQYDSKSRIIQFGDIYIEYDSGNKVIKVSQINKKYEQYFRFEYDNSSNISKVFSSEQPYSLTGKEKMLSNAQFDSIDNPFYNLPIEFKIYLLGKTFFARGKAGLEPMVLFSKNNISNYEEEYEKISQKVIEFENSKPTIIERTSSKFGKFILSFKYSCN